MLSEIHLHYTKYLMLPHNVDIDPEHWMDLLIVRLRCKNFVPHYEVHQQPDLIEFQMPLEAM